MMFFSFCNSGLYVIVCKWVSSIFQKTRESSTGEKCWVSFYFSFFLKATPATSLQFQKFSRNKLQVVNRSSKLKIAREFHQFRKIRELYRKDRKGKFWNLKSGKTFCPHNHTESQSGSRVNVLCCTFISEQRIKFW